MKRNIGSRRRVAPPRGHRRRGDAVGRRAVITGDGKRRIGRGVRVLVPLCVLALIPFLDAATAAAPRLPSLSISPSVSIEEGGAGTTNASFKVTLSAPSHKVVRVRFATDGFFATEGTDYRRATGTLVFKPGQRSKQILVQIIGDTVPEDVEDFYVNLSNPRNARLRIAQATARIVANDLPAPFTVAADLKASDGPGTGRAVITLDAPKGEARFTLEVRNSPRDPLSVHIHSRTFALGGGFRSLQPVPPRDGIVTGAIQVTPRTILMMDANLADFVVDVHVDPLGNVPGDLTGDLRRVP